MKTLKLQLASFTNSAPVLDWQYIAQADSLN